MVGLLPTACFAGEQRMTWTAQTDVLDAVCPLHWSAEKIYRKPKALCALWSLNFADIGNPFKYFQSGLPALAVCAEIRAGAEKRCAYGKVMADISDSTEKIAPVLPRIYQRFALILCCMITASFSIHTPFALMLNR